MSKPTEGPHDASIVSDRTAGALLLAFLGAVILVLALANMPPIPIEGATSHEPMGNSQLELPDEHD